MSAVLPLDTEIRASIRAVETQMRSLADARTRMIERLAKELLQTTTYVRSPMGWDAQFDPSAAEDLMANLAGVARLHSALLLRWTALTKQLAQVEAARLAAAEDMPPEARAALVGLRLIDGALGRKT